MLRGGEPWTQLCCGMIPLESKGQAFSTPLSGAGCWLMGMVTSPARRLLSAMGKSPRKGTAGIAVSPLEPSVSAAEGGRTSLVEGPGCGTSRMFGGGQSREQKGAGGEGHSGAF